MRRPCNRRYIIRNVTVLGAGGWGTALAVHLARIGHEAHLWARDAALAADVQQRRFNPVYLPEIRFPANLRVTADLGDALNGSDLDNALVDLAGEIHASQLRLQVTDGRMVTDLVRNQLSAFDHDSEEDPTYNQRGKSPRWWLQFTGGHSTYDTGELSGATSNIGGSGGGFDFKPSGNWTVGGGGSFSFGNLSLTEISGSTDLKAPRAFGYSSFGFGPFHWHGGGSASKTKNDTKRDIKFAARVPDENGNMVPLGDGVDREAESDQGGDVEDGWTELQHTKNWTEWTLDSKGGWRTARLTFNRPACTRPAYCGSQSAVYISRALIWSGCRTSTRSPRLARGRRPRRTASRRA